MDDKTQQPEPLVAAERAGSAETIGYKPAEGRTEGLHAKEAKMYFLVNADLKMKPGKIAAQVGHAAFRWGQLLYQNPTESYRSWLTTGEAKIALKATEAELIALLTKFKNLVITVHDQGRTQIAAGSLTVVAFAPLLPDLVPPELAKLKLL